MSCQARVDAIVCEAGTPPLGGSAIAAPEGERYIRYTPLHRPIKETLATVKNTTILKAVTLHMHGAQCTAGDTFQYIGTYGANFTFENIDELCMVRVYGIGNNQIAEAYKIMLPQLMLSSVERSRVHLAFSVIAADTVDMVKTWGDMEHKVVYAPRRRSRLGRCPGLVEHCAVEVLELRVDVGTSAR